MIDEIKKKGDSSPILWEEGALVLKVSEVDIIMAGLV